MVAFDKMQLHFSAMLISIDAQKKNQAAAIALVADNPIAPLTIMSTPRQKMVRRTKSFGERLRGRNDGRPKPTKKKPRRTVSAPCRILKNGECSSDARWKSETSNCGCSATKDRRSMRRATITCEGRSSPISTKTAAERKAAPRAPRRSTDDNQGPRVLERPASLPPRLPVRKGGDAMTESQAMPPQIPIRRPELELECC